MYGLKVPWQIPTLCVSNIAQDILDVYVLEWHCLISLHCKRDTAVIAESTQSKRICIPNALFD